MRISRCVFTALVACQAISPAQQTVKVAFITRNAYGNNLYLDNVTIGHQYPSDVGLVRVTNIPSDTSYAVGSGSIVIAPGVALVNLGTLPIGSPFNVTFNAMPGGYTSTRTVSSLARGAMVQLVMDSLAIPVSTPMTFTVVSVLPADQNRSNDTITQSTLFLPGVRRMVLLEEWTSSTCGPCAANNPAIDAFIAAKNDSLVALKYHVGWPAPGDDPMYLYNPTQSYDRRYYYAVNSVPHVIMDGVVTPTYPYTTPSSLPDAFAVRHPLGTPVAITVRDSALTGDSLEARVMVTIHSAMRAGTYRLRVQAVERRIHYSVPPGTNGEQEFLEVFRGSYPASAGTVLPTSPGTYVFSFRYRQAAPAIRDSLFTIAYVQNDVTKEVLNAGKPSLPVSIASRITITGPPIGTREVCRSVETPAGSSEAHSFASMALAGGFHSELFELGFPPQGWRLANPDAGITLDRYTGANGPSFGGDVSTKMDFYSYSGSGQTDTLYTGGMTGLLPTDSLTFDWAYAQYPGYSDQLIVRVSTNGGVTYDSTIFDKSGAVLATAPSTSNSFIPLTSQWRTYRYPLSGLIRAVPLTPTLVQPENGAAGISLAPRLTWSRIPGALTYRMQVSTDSGFSAVSYSDSTITDTTRMLPVLAPGATFFWRVNAANVVGSGPWSETHRFTTVVFLTSVCPVRGSWNLIALPLTVSDPRRTALFPSATSEAYTFDAASGYVRRDSLLNGIGYWLKFADSGSVAISGYERTSDTVAIGAGWNLVGSLTSPIPVGAIQQIPTGILVSSFYGYGTGYASADTVQPAKGYWVKASGPGNLVLVPLVRRK
jgi:hypothetical protein